MLDPDTGGITVHFAQTLDGRIATSAGHSHWISGEDSLVFAHELRAQHRAVMVGAGTVVSDNPRLTVRHVNGESPLRVILDSTLRLPLDAHVLTDGAAPTLVASTERADSSRVEVIQATGAEVIRLSEDGFGRVDLDELIRLLRARGACPILVEGGGELITALFRARLVDRLIVCIAPKIIGAGVDAVGDLNILRMDCALTFSRSEFREVGEDIIFDGWLER